MAKLQGTTEDNSSSQQSNTLQLSSRGVGIINSISLNSDSTKSVKVVTLKQTKETKE